VIRKYTKAAQRSRLQFSFPFATDATTRPLAPTAPARPARRPAERAADMKTFAALPAAMRAHEPLILRRWVRHAESAPTARTAQLARDALRVLVRSATRCSAQTGASALHIAVAAAKTVQEALAAWHPADTPAASRPTLNTPTGTTRRLARRSAGARRLLQRVTERSRQAGEGTLAWNTVTLETDLGSLREHWDALVAWLSAAVSADTYPTWDYTWRGERPSWVMALAAPTRHRPPMVGGARASRRVPRAA
jgi:hypothetical protein